MPISARNRLLSMPSGFQGLFSGLAEACGPFAAWGWCSGLTWGRWWHPCPCSGSIRSLAWRPVREMPGWAAV